MIEKKLKNGILKINHFSFLVQQKFISILAKKNNDLKIDFTTSNETSFLALLLDDEIQEYFHKILMPQCIYNGKPINYPNDFDYFDVHNKGYTEDNKPHAIKLQEDYLEIIKEIFEVTLPLYLKVPKKSELEEKIETK
jgi:hypothetical protein